MNLVKMNSILNGTFAETLISNTYPSLILIQLYIGELKGEIQNANSILKVNWFHQKISQKLYRTGQFLHLE